MNTMRSARAPCMEGRMGDGNALIPRLPAGVDDQVVSHFRSSAKAVILENRHKLLAFGRGSRLGCTYEIHPSPGTRKPR